MIEIPKSRQQEEFEYLANSILSLLARLSPEDQNDVHAYTMELYRDRHTNTKEGK